jgi:putative ABC transport system ATP-binding protein
MIPTDGPPALELRDVTRVHGDGAIEVQALRAVSVTLTRGELIAVTGPSGSGKSTLLHLAGGLDTPTSGDVLIDGRSVVSLSATARAAARRRHVGYVFQELNLMPSLTAAENVMLPRELDGVSRRTARGEALTVLAEVGLDGAADRFPDQLSGGEQQRVAIARSLVGPRHVILADEPTGALDSVTGDAILALLRARVDAGAAAILVTHEPRHAAWADRIVRLVDGRIVDETVARPEAPAPDAPAPEAPVAGR